MYENSKVSGKDNRLYTMTTDLLDQIKKRAINYLKHISYYLIMNRKGILYYFPESAEKENYKKVRKNFHFNKLLVDRGIVKHT